LRRWKNSRILEREQSKHVHPIRLVLREFTKFGWDSGPRAELFFKDSRTKMPIASILVPCRDSSNMTHKFSPVLEENMGVKGLVG